jgi:hypothetical protein
VPAQLARRAAHAGTTTGEGTTEGVGEGLGLNSGLGLDEGLGVGELAVGVWLAAGASGPFGVHAAAAARQRRSATPNLTGYCNEQGCGRVTSVPSLRKSPRIPLGP